LRIQSSRTFVPEPEDNGCVDRFTQTLRENLFWVHSFHSVEQLTLHALVAFNDLHNHPGLSNDLGPVHPLKPGQPFWSRWHG